MQQKLERHKQKASKELEREMKERARAKRQAENEARAAKQKRKAENEFAGTKMQVISDPNKLKKMTKKQLRMVKKTVVDSDGVTRLVGAYQ